MAAARGCDHYPQLQAQLRVALLSVEFERLKAMYASQQRTFRTNIRAVYQLQQKSAAYRRWTADMRESRAISAMRTAATRPPGIGVPIEPL